MCVCVCVCVHTCIGNIWRQICNYFDNRLKILSCFYSKNFKNVIVPGSQMPLFLVLHYNKLNILGIWLLVGQTKTFDEVITYCD